MRYLTLLISIFAFCFLQGCVSQQSKTPLTPVKAFTFTEFHGDSPLTGLRKTEDKFSAISEYQVVWQKDTAYSKSGYEGGELMAVTTFAGKDNGEVGKGIYLPASLFCEIIAPDGNTSKFTAELPGGVSEYHLAFPQTKWASWQPGKPAFYNFKFVYKNDEGIQTDEVHYGFNRMDPVGQYFRFEGQSLYLRGGYDPERRYILPGREAEGFDLLRKMGFNLYVGKGKLTREIIDAAGQIGVMLAWVTDDGSIPLEGINEAEYEIITQDSPAWIGSAKFSPEDTSVINFQVDNPYLYWDAALSSGSIPAQPDVSEELHPTCNFFPGSKTESSANGFTLINQFRNVAWSAGFIIPVEMADTPEVKPLMTDDFLVINLDGFPEEIPIKVKAGTKLQIPVQVANFKPKGDRGGAVWWVWEQTGQEGRPDYPELPNKGFNAIDPIIVPIPIQKGEYNLKFELLDFDGYSQAFNKIAFLVE